MAQRIKLAKYGYTVVDDQDHGWLSEFKWHLNGDGYVETCYTQNGKSITKTMHRLIMGEPKGMDVDHKDLIRSNNQRSNLRVVSRSFNMANLPARSGKKLSKYKGVSKLNRPNLKKPWLAYVRKDYKTHYLGYFATPEEAAQAYNNKAKELFGESALLNVIDKGQQL